MKKQIELQKEEQDLLLDTLVKRRNTLLEEEKPAEDLSELLGKVLTSPAKKAEEVSHAER